MDAMLSAGPVIELSARDLPAYCPNPSMPLWESHPRVFLDVINEGEVICPYCGTRYRFRRGVHVHDEAFDTRGLHQHRELHEALPEGGFTAAGGHPGAEETPNIVDAQGNTTLERMTRWIRTGR